MSHENGPNGKLRDDLLRQADETRNKLARTVELIDRRRHDAFDVRKQVGKHLKPLAVAAGLVVLAAAGASAFVMHRLISAVERRRSSRSGWRLPRVVVAGPEPERAKRRSFLREVLRSLALTAVTTLLARPVRQALSGARHR